MFDDMDLDGLADLLELIEDLAVLDLDDVDDVDLDASCFLGLGPLSDLDLPNPFAEAADADAIAGECFEDSMSRFSAETGFSVDLPTVTYE